jgi:hypothetical protein
METMGESPIDHSSCKISHNLEHQSRNYPWQKGTHKLTSLAKSDIDILLNLKGG